jgi:hypothetical protein
MKMARMIEQTVNAIQRMQVAGFDRSEFRVHTPRRHGEYDYAVITLLVPETVITNREAAILAAGLGIQQYVGKNGNIRRWITTRGDLKGQIRDLGDLGKN